MMPACAKDKTVFAVFSCLWLAACAPQNEPLQSNQSALLAKPTSVDQADLQSLPYYRSVVHAINVGGEAYTGADGIEYAADDLRLDAPKKRSQNIKGTQDPELFETYRQGDLSFELPVENGQYDITFKFAEPEDIPVGGRLFDIVAEDGKVLDNVDVRLQRDGKTLSALVKTVTDVTVDDGSLSIQFDAIERTPLLHGLIVRKKVQDQRDWQLVWNDEFNGETIDPSKWSFDLWDARKVNDEDQAYTDRAKNARIEDGQLIIEAHKEQYDNAEYTSARLHTLGKADFQYGRVDVRARVPAGQGTWSAIWMLPSDPFKYASKCGPGEDWQGSRSCDAWPNSGEIDIMEHVGYDMQNVHGTVHNKAYYWVNWEQRKASVEGKDIDQAFHVYSLEWTPEYIVVLFDDTPYFYYKNDQTGWQSWPYDHPYHLILNLAIGGAWGRAGGPIDDSIFPVRMEVDYVRIYQQDKTTTD